MHCKDSDLEAGLASAKLAQTISAGDVTFPVRFCLQAFAFFTCGVYRMYRDENVTGGKDHLGCSALSGHMMRAITQDHNTSYGRLQ